VSSAVHHATYRVTGFFILGFWRRHLQSNHHHPLRVLTKVILNTMSSGTGIQDLMAAETRASQIVAEARIGT